jgi:hypothetical protein
LPGAVGPDVSALASVVAVTTALGADALPDGSTATTVNECVVAAASRRTVAARSPVHSTFARAPFAKTRYVLANTTEGETVIYMRDSHTH